MKDVTINLRMPADINEYRKKRKLTWRKLIEKGIASIEAETYIAEAAQTLMKAHTTLKGKK